ncbi:MAG: S41 family peptidase [Bacilli bacterium]
MSKDIKKSVEFNLVEVIFIILITGIVVSVASGLIVFKNYDKLSSVASSDSTTNFSEFNKAYNHIVNSYVKEVDKDKLIEAAIEGMYTYLNDEYSIYMDEETTKSLEERLDGQYTGVGIEITTDKNNKIIINKVFSNSSAMDAGLKAGDELIALDGVLLSDKEYTYVSDTIKNSKKDTFMIKYIREGKEYEVTLKKKNVLIDSVVSKEYENVGYIQIQTFSATSSKQVKDKINNFSKNIDSLVIDVRNNTGGYLSAAYEIADYFVAKGKPIYQLKDRENKITIYKAKNDVLRDFKGISVLINNYSASASEILALALKESANATTIGVKSYGKGTVQETDTLSSGAMIKYTTAYWLSPNGNTINTIGISPDIEEKNAEKQLDIAIKMYKK